MKREVKDTDASTCPPSVRTARRFGSNAIVKECVAQAAVAYESAGAPTTEAAVTAATAAVTSSTTRRAISPDGTPGEDRPAMKLGEALTLRSQLQTRIEQLRETGGVHEGGSCRSCISGGATGGRQGFDSPPAQRSA